MDSWNGAAKSNSVSRYAMGVLWQHPPSRRPAPQRGLGSATRPQSLPRPTQQCCPNCEPRSDRREQHLSELEPALRRRQRLTQRAQDALAVLDARGRLARIDATQSVHDVTLALTRVLGLMGAA